MLPDDPEAYSWTQDSLDLGDFARDLSAQVAQTGGQVPSAHGPEPEDLQPEWSAYRDTMDHCTLLNGRCGLEFISFDNHHIPTIEACAYPWFHTGEHGTAIPELWREWDRFARYLEERGQA